jgi:hypothetical protein
VPEPQPTLTERQRIKELLAAIRAHWVKANGEDSMSVSALDQIAEVIADGSYVKHPALTDAQLDSLWIKRDCIKAIQDGDIMAQVRAFARTVLAAGGAKP